MARLQNQKSRSKSGIEKSPTKWSSNIPGMQPIGESITMKGSGSTSRNSGVEEENKKAYEQQVQDRNSENQAQWQQIEANKNAIALQANLESQKTAQPTAQLNQLEAKPETPQTEETTLEKIKNAGNSVIDTISTGLGLGFIGLLAFAGGPIGLGLVGADTLTNWVALDNVMGQGSILLSKLKSDMSSATPEQRIQILQSAEQAKKSADVAKYKITFSTIVDPAMWPFKKLWLSGIETTENSINYNLQAIRNYDPMMDQWSNESTQLKAKKNLQTYGKPKYDEEGNPLQ